MAMNVAPSNPHCGPVVHSAGDGYLRIVRHHDGVVHQHTHGDDKSRQ